MKVLAHKIKQYIFLFFYFKKLDFLKRLAYPGNFWFFIGSLLIQLGFNLFFLKIIFNWIDDLQGWNYYQVLIVAGSVMLIDGFMWMCFAYLHDFKNQIRTGTLDFLLVKPKNVRFLVSVHRGDLEDVARLILGGTVIVYAASQLNLWNIDMVDNLFWYLVVLFNGGLIVYSLVSILSCLSFWTIENSMTFYLVESFMRAGQYPTDIFSRGWLRNFFTFGIPLAFLGTVPAKVFLEGFVWQGLLFSSALAGGLFWLSSLIWKKGLAKYSSASS